MTKPCSRCGDPVQRKDNRGNWKSQCNPCLAKGARERRRARKDPTAHDYATSTVPDGYEIAGVSQLDKATGRWVKTRKIQEPKRDLRKELADVVAALCEPYQGSAAPEPPPTDCDPDLAVVVPIGDMHVGLRCHMAETGLEDYRLEDAEANLIAGVDGLLESAPPAADFVLINVGDYLHADSSRNTTTKGTPLDVDGSRFDTVLVALRMLRRCVDKALERHERVTVIIATGNHDGESSLWLRICLSAVYENEPRVIIRTEPDKFHWYRHGRCLFGVTHGDTCKVDQLPLIMATDQREAWGETEHRHWYTGHIHHVTVKEMPGCTVETFRTLAPRDKWHSWEGYRSERDLRLDVWHREYGHVQRLIYGIKRIRSRHK